MASATLIALFLLSALTFYAPSTTAQPVKDWNGNIVKNGDIFGTFYILPSLLGAPGGVRLLPTGNEPFPVSVVLSPFEDDTGLPVTIKPILQSTYSPEGQAVSLSFDREGTSLFWTAVEGFPEGALVKIDRYYPDPVKGLFYIRDSIFGLKDSINLFFCRSLIGVIPACGNVTIVKSDGNWLLAVTQEKPYDFRLLPTSADA